MAKKRTAGSVDYPMPMEPSPKQEFSWALDRAVEKAVLAHPRTQKLREVIKQRMTKAAGNGDGEAEKPVKKSRPVKKG